MHCTHVGSRCHVVHCVCKSLPLLQPLWGFGPYISTQNKKGLSDMGAFSIVGTADFVILEGKVVA